MGDVVELRPAEPVTVTERPLREARAHLLQTIDDAGDLLRWLSERGREEVALDTETTGLDRFRDYVRLVQIGDEMDGWVVPFERWGGVIEDLVNRYQGEYLMHNAPYDWMMLAKEGIQLPRAKIADTRVMAHVLSSTGPLGLKPLSQKEVDPAAGAAQEALNTGIGSHGGWTWANVPVTFQPYWMYAGLDTILTKRLKNQLWPRVQATAPLSYQLEMQVLWVCVDMELKGAAVDRQYTLDLRDQLAAYQHEVEQWCHTYYHLNPGNSESVARQLLADGIVLDQFTPKGNLVLDKYVLEPLDHPLAQAVLGRRRAQKMVSTYLNSYLDLADADGRIHPSINTIGGTSKNPFEPGGTRGVRTGRMSMDTPNLQNVPKHTAMGSKIRNCFVPSCTTRCDCGQAHKWIKYDADQIEFRIFAHLTGDPALVEMFRQARASGVDVFTAAAQQIFGDPTLSKHDLRRQHTKNSFYAIIYGAGVEQFAKTAGLFHPGTRQADLGAASAFLQRLHGMYPGIRQLQSRIEAEGFQRQQAEGAAYTRSPLTNRKHTADQGREYALMNYVVQGTAGEVLKMKIVEAYHAGLGEFMTFPVHDEIDLDVPEGQLGDVLHTLDDIMNDDSLFDVPITWSGDLGSRWGECE